MKKILILLLTFILFQNISLAEDKFGFGLELIKQEDGVVVNSVIKNSKAEKLGVFSGQKISKVNGKKANKIQENDLLNIDNNKTLKLVSKDNKQYNLVPENITLLNSYNRVIDTYNTNTQYKVNDYKTDKIIHPNKLESERHIKYANALFNYAEAISIQSLKEYVHIFKITQDDVNLAIEQAKINDKDNPYFKYISDEENKYIYGNGFKQFNELKIYSELNRDLINKQISEFNSLDIARYIKIIYNTKIVANLYYLANNELTIYVLRKERNNTLNKILTDLSTANDLYKSVYDDFCKSLSYYPRKYDFKKPGFISNVEQTSMSAPNVKCVNNKEIITLATQKGYNPNNNAEIKKIAEEKLKQQKQREAEEAKKKIAEQKIAEQKSAEQKSTTTKTAVANTPKTVPVKRTQVYTNFFYQAAKACEGQIKIGFTASAPYYCLAERLMQTDYMTSGLTNGTLPYIFAAVYPGEKANQIATNPAGSMMAGFYYQTLAGGVVEIIARLGLTKIKIDQEVYNIFIYGK